MAMVLPYVSAFVCEGILCLIGQILIDKTKLTPARILVIYVVSGVVLSFFGIYDRLISLCGAGASVPLTGFGYALSKGVSASVQDIGFLGIFVGGVSATAGGIAAAIFFGFLVSLLFKPKSKK